MRFAASRVLIWPEGRHRAEQGCSRYGRHNAEDTVHSVQDSDVLACPSPWPTHGTHFCTHWQILDDRTRVCVHTTGGRTSKQDSKQRNMAVNLVGRFGGRTLDLDLDRHHLMLLFSVPILSGVLSWAAVVAPPGLTGRQATRIHGQILMDVSQPGTSCRAKGELLRSFTVGECRRRHCGSRDEAPTVIFDGRRSTRVPFAHCCVSQGPRHKPQRGHGG